MGEIEEWTLEEAVAGDRHGKDKDQVQGKRLQGPERMPSGAGHQEELLPYIESVGDATDGAEGSGFEQRCRLARGAEHGGGDHSRSSDAFKKRGEFRGHNDKRDPDTG